MILRFYIMLTIICTSYLVKQQSVEVVQITVGKKQVLDIFTMQEMVAGAQWHVVLEDLAFDFLEHAHQLEPFSPYFHAFSSYLTLYCETISLSVLLLLNENELAKHVVRDIKVRHHYPQLSLFSPFSHGEFISKADVFI